MYQDGKMTEEEKDELLVRLDERTNTIKTMLCNHLAHHMKRDLVAWAAALTAISSLVIVLLTK